MSDQIEIRMLGRLWVRAGNGQIVPAAQWTTGKTTDLLRLLAVNAGRTVTSASLIEKLWPDVETARAAASLRTATTQIRKALGRDCVTNLQSGLRMDGAWVDVATHGALAVEAGTAMRVRDFPRVVAVAKQADALYVDDFRAFDDDAEWARDIRDELRTQRRLMLADAAESALELGWMRDAIALSTLAINLDSSFERAHRALMRAYAGIGEVDSAARTYERCRRNLMNELGATPSAQTRALHQQLLSTELHEGPFFTYVGRESTLAELTDALRACAHGDGTGMVCVAGAPGSGREALLQTAVERLTNAHLRPVRPLNAKRQQPVRAMAPTNRPTDIAVMGPLDMTPTRAHAAMAEFLAAVDPQPGRVLVMLTSPEATELLRGDVPADRYEVHGVESPEMNESDLGALAGTLLAGPASPELTAVLQSRSAGLAGAAVGILRAWMSTGQIISTARGLALINEAPAATALPGAAATFRLLADQLEPVHMEICQVLAVLDRAASAGELIEILGTDRRTVRRRLETEEQLDDLARRGILRTYDGTYEFLDRTTQDLFELWLRPSLRDRIVQRVHDREREPELVGAGAHGTTERRTRTPGRRATDRV